MGPLCCPTGSATVAMFCYARQTCTSLHIINVSMGLAMAAKLSIQHIDPCTVRANLATIKFQPVTINFLCNLSCKILIGHH